MPFLRTSCSLRVRARWHEAKKQRVILESFRGPILRLVNLQLQRQRYVYVVQRLERF
jgi:hypothetical protein